MEDSQPTTTRAGRQADQRRAVLLVLIGVPVVFALALVVALSQVNAPRPDIDIAYGDLPQRTLDTGEPILGSPDAPVMLIEYSNFSCPGCLQYTGTMHQIIARFVSSGQAQFVFMPIVFGYGDDPSFVAAQAALCAIPQNGFWQMHDALFELHRTRGRGSFTADMMRDTATTLGLDAASITQCMLAGDTSAVVEGSIQSAIDRGVESTPTLLYSLDGGKTVQSFTRADGAPYVGGPSIDVVEQVVSRAGQGG